GYSTVVMGASFRNIGEIIELAGCDRLTIGPALLEELANTDVEIIQKLVATAATHAAPTALTEEQFRWAFNEDPMAVDKLAEGIRNFAIDQGKLEVMLKTKLS
ncbi:transaldolase, partial [Shewanella sp. SG41-4]|uniref:transaldolase family protein n=1 Tax=Shewanella sp. SG41-4 TaxID=2760976 RepID=UPI0018321BC3